ncbi:MAG TPA: hypothetical protein VGB30_07855 [bacterium]|jgi:hypothetical protein
MNLRLISLLQNLHHLHGQKYFTQYPQRQFEFLFHDTTKLRFRLEDRDISVPISILLLGIIQLISRKHFDKAACTEILGKDWGFQFVARILLECDDVGVGEGYGFKLVPIAKARSHEYEEFVPPPAAKSNPNGGDGEME